MIKKRKEIIDTFLCSEGAFVCGLTPRMPFDADLVFQVGLNTAGLVLGAMESRPTPTSSLPCLLRCNNIKSSNSVVDRATVGVHPSEDELILKCISF